MDFVHPDSGATWVTRQNTAGQASSGTHQATFGGRQSTTRLSIAKCRVSSTSGSRQTACGITI